MTRTSEDVKVNNEWAAVIPPQQWAAYEPVLRAVHEQGILCAIGGGFAMNSYAGHWRNTKDMDLYCLPCDRAKLIEILTRAGLRDLYDEKPYERHWLYRGTKDCCIVDIIWAMANRRDDVDEAWLTRGPEIELRGRHHRLIPVEELLWAKLYVIQRDRCDWGDVINLIQANGPAMDWEHLIDRLSADKPLLTAVLSMFCWLNPDRAADLPAWIWDRLKMPVPQPGCTPEAMRGRADLLDTRPWFTPVLPEPQPRAA